MQVIYDAAADRLLWQVRTRAGEIIAVWLTRRMVARLWPPFLKLVTQSTLINATPQATVMPEARDMLAQAARERPLASADFKTRFDATPTARPLGAEPLLATQVDMAGASAGGLTIRIREGSGRSAELMLSSDLATALMRLIEKAVGHADWGLGVPAQTADDAALQPPALLN